MWASPSIISFLKRRFPELEVAVTADGQPVAAEQIPQTGQIAAILLAGYGHAGIRRCSRGLRCAGNCRFGRRSRLSASAFHNGPQAAHLLAQLPDFITQLPDLVLLRRPAFPSGALARRRLTGARRDAPATGAEQDEHPGRYRQSFYASDRCSQILAPLMQLSCIYAEQRKN